MRILAIDTTSDALSLALSAGGKVYACHKKPKAPHDETLLAAAECLLSRAGLRLEGLGALAAASGPGRFTGIRIGMAFAAVAASRLEIPAVGVTLFEAIAFKTPGPLVCAVVPGIRNEKYLQLFERKTGAPRPVEAPAWIEEKSWPEAKDAMERRGAILAQAPVTAADLLAPAIARLSRRAPLDFQPLYLKPAGYERAVVR